MVKFTRTLITGCALGGLALGLASAAQAQQTGSGSAPQNSVVAETQEIIVTAQKRTESLQKVPVAVTAVDSGLLNRLGITTPLSLGPTVPSMSLQTNSGVTYIYLRGVGNNFLGLGIDGNVAYHSNGVYVASPRAQVTGYFDVDRIEVVRGPQGDLYGRNATGGSINVISKKPTDEVSGYANVTVGNYSLFQGEAAIGGPVAGDKLMVRAALFYIDRGGYGKNLNTGKDINDRNAIGSRFTVEANPTEKLKIEIIGDYYHSDDADGVATFAGGALGNNPPSLTELFGGATSNIRDNRSSADQKYTRTVWGIQGTASLALSENIDLKSTTAYRKEHFTAVDDIAGTPNPLLAPITQLEQQKQFSQEVQLLASGSRWDAILGAYYFDQTANGFINVPLDFFAPGAKFDQRGEGTTKAYAMFAHGSWEFVDRLKLIVGGRYSYEKRTNVGSFTNFYTLFPIQNPDGSPLSAHFEAFTPKATLQFEPSDDVTLYAGVSKGFKSGGFTIGVPGAALKPETLLSYEAGLKIRAFDRRLTANFAAFYYDYKNIVVTKILQNATFNENAAKATIKGFEAEITARPTNNLRFDASLGILDATFKQFVTGNNVYPIAPGFPFPDPISAPAPQSLAGNRLPGTSKYTLRLGAEYAIPVGAESRIVLNGDAYFSGDMYFDAYQRKTAYQPSYQTYNASATYEFNKSWSITGWIRNLTNETVISNQVITDRSFAYPRVTYLQDPRTFGGTVRASF